MDKKETLNYLFEQTPAIDPATHNTTKVAKRYVITYTKSSTWRTILPTRKRPRVTGFSVTLYGFFGYTLRVFWLLLPFFVLVSC